MLIKRILTATLLATILLVSSSVKAHDGYPSSCCTGKDCHTVDCREIEETKEGWVWNGNKFRKDQKRNFDKSGCHVCIHPSAGPLCIQTFDGT